MSTNPWQGVVALFAAILLALSVSAAAPPANPKAQALTTELERATSLQQVAQAFKRAGLSQAEQQQFQASVSPALRQKIETIISQARPIGKTKATHMGAQRLEAAKRAKATQVKAPSNLNAALARARTVARAAAPRRIASTARPPMPTTSGSITSVSPTTVKVGGTLTIVGSGLGTGGHLKALLGLHDRFDCSTSTWTPTRIVATVSLEVEPLVREAPLAGFIQVFPTGEASGPWAEVTFAADPVRLTPEITAISPDPITTRGNVLVTGNNFLSTQPGTITLTGRNRYGPTSHPLVVTEWTDTYVYGYVPEDGSPEWSGGFQLVLRNHLGREGTRSVGFEVETELREVRMSPKRVHCEHWDDNDDEPSWICFVGKKNDYQFAWGRCDLQVVDAGYDIIDEGGPGHGFAWIEKPRGDTVWGSYEIWADLYSWFEVRAWVIVEVPVGADCGQNIY